MRPIGFSTGAIARGDFNRALALLEGYAVTAVELSALREDELTPLVTALPSLELARFSYVAFHAPSRLIHMSETKVVEMLAEPAQCGWNVIVHPDIITDHKGWSRLGNRLCIENMDKRKRAGRTAEELRKIFSKLPDARLCFDIAHARQVDPTMCNAAMILREFGGCVIQVHISELDTQGHHRKVTLAGSIAFAKVLHCVPDEAAIIIESVVAEDEIGRELSIVHDLFVAEDVVALATD